MTQAPLLHLDPSPETGNSTQRIVTPKPKGSTAGPTAETTHVPSNLFKLQSFLNNPELLNGHNTAFETPNRKRQTKLETDPLFISYSTQVTTVHSPVDFCIGPYLYSPLRSFLALPYLGVYKIQTIESVIKPKRGTARGG